MEKDTDYFENDPLSSHRESSEDGLLEIPVLGRRKSPWWRLFASNVSIISIHVLLLYIGTVMTLGLFVSHDSSHSCPDVELEESHPSLLGGIVQFEQRPEYHSPWYPWSQEPSDDLDALWEDLVFAQNIRITPSEMQALNENTTNGVRLTDGDFAAALGVYHHLHCLNSIRKMLHKDYYEKQPQAAYPAETLTPEHGDHCIDILRQALMCHANTAVYAAEWIADSHVKTNKKVRSGASTSCVKWDTVNDWASRRALRPGNYLYAPGPFEKSHSSG